MKIKRVIVICLICSVCFLCISGFALKNSQEYEIELIEIEKGEKEEYRERFSISCLGKESKDFNNNFIYCFDVSDSGECAILFDDATVVIMDSEGNTKNVLKFKEEILDSRMLETYIEWNGDNLVLILRYGVVCVFTASGEVIDVFKYETDRNSLPKCEKITVNEDTYAIKYSNIFIHYLGGERYDMLVKSNAYGETVLFNSRKMFPAVTILVFIYVIVFSAAIVYVLLKRIKKKHKESTV